MSFSAYNPHDRYRQRAIHRFSTFLRFCALAAFFGFAGFWLGAQHGQKNEQVTQMRIKELQEEKQGLERDVTALRAEAQTANIRFNQLQEEYNRILPKGPVRELSALLRQQMEEGIDPERMAFVIRSARPPRNCSDPETRRFVVSTPTYQGPDSQIVLADGAITIQGGGVSARNDKGSPEAWYDPTQAVTLSFVLLGGEQETKKGTLPLHHSLVAGEREYRFTISEGAKSFAKVTFDSCDYP